MRYEKPKTVELGSRAVRAEGERSLACVSGGSAGEFETCSTGPAPWAGPNCAAGGAATGNGDCISGTAVRFYCETGASGVNDPYGCRVGPSVV